MESEATRPVEEEEASGEVGKTEGKRGLAYGEVVFFGAAGGGEAGVVVG